MPCLVALRPTLSLPWSVFGPVLLFLSRATSFFPSAIRVPSSRFDRRHYILWVVLGCTLALILYALVVAASYHEVDLAFCLLARAYAQRESLFFHWSALLVASENTTTLFFALCERLLQRLNPLFRR
jgi:hypothetical protein